MAYIGRQLARGENKLFDDISSSFNGSTTTFNLTVSSVATSTATPYQLFVSLGGVMQKPNTDFTTAGNQITFTTAPAAGLSCWIMMQGDTIDNAAVADASITPSKISGSNFAFSGDLRLKDADGSHYVGFASPSTVSTNKVWTLPAADGTASQYLQTNGSGVLSWSTVSVGGATGIDFNDNVKIQFGASNDLQIWHSGANKIVSNNSMTMYIGADQTQITNAGITEACAKFIADGAVELYHNNSKKFETSSTGVSITGALTVSTNATITGNLTVSGTTTTVDSVTLSVKDKNIEMGVVGSPSDTTADGGGITLKGSTDKTINWVNSTDAWTFSEHINIAAGKKLGVGGANYGTSGQVLTSGGSGAAPSWAAVPPGGNTVDLVADGAIAAGKPVIITSAGKAAQVAEVATLITSAPNASNITYMTTSSNDPGHANSSRIAYSPDDNLLINTFVKQSGTQYPHYRLWKPSTSAGQITAIGNGDVIVSHQGSGDGLEAICYLSSSRFVYVYNRVDQNKARLAVGTVSGSGDSRTISWSADQELDGQAASFYRGYQIQKIGANRIAVFCVAGNGSCRWTDDKPGVIIVDISSSTATYRSSAQLSSDNASNSFYYLSLAYNSTDDLLLATWRRSGSIYRMRAFKVNSNTSATITTGTELSTSDTNGRQTMVWQSPQNKFIFIYNQGAASSIKHVVCSVNSSTLAITQGTTNTISSSSGKSNEGLDLVVSAQNTLHLKTIDNSRNPYTYRDDSFDGSNFNIDQEGKSSTSFDGYLDGDVHSVCMTQSATEDIVSVYGTVSSVTNYKPAGIINKTVSPTTNATTTNVIGFAENAINDTATGTIKLPGNVVGNQSSLTVGTAYYIQANGTLGTSQDNSLGAATGFTKAGVALSATTLKIADYV